MKNSSVIWIGLLLIIIAGVAIVIFGRSKGNASNDGTAGTSPGLSIKDLLYKAPVLNLNSGTATGADLLKYRQAAGQAY